MRYVNFMERHGHKSKDESECAQRQQPAEIVKKEMSQPNVVQSNETAILTLGLRRVMTWSESKGEWIKFDKPSDKDKLELALLQDSKTKNIRCLVYAKNAKGITKAASNHYLHPETKLKEPDSQSAAFWVQDWVDQKETSKQLRDVCLLLTFEERSMIPTFVREYSKGQASMAALHAQTKDVWCRLDNESSAGEASTVEGESEKDEQDEDVGEENDEDELDEEDEVDDDEDFDDEEEVDEEEELDEDEEFEEDEVDTGGPVSGKSVQSSKPMSFSELGLKQNQNNWKCNECYSFNPLTEQSCKSCEAPKPGVSSKSPKAQESTQKPTSNPFAGFAAASSLSAPSPAVSSTPFSFSTGGGSSLFGGGAAKEVPRETFSFAPTQDRPAIVEGKSKEVPQQTFSFAPAKDKPAIFESKASNPTVGLAPNPSFPMEPRTALGALSFNSFGNKTSGEADKEEAAKGSGNGEIFSIKKDESAKSHSGLSFGIKKDETLSQKATPSFGLKNAEPVQGNGSLLFGGVKKDEPAKADANLLFGVSSLNFGTPTAAPTGTTKPEPTASMKSELVGPAPPSSLFRFNSAEVATSNGKGDNKLSSAFPNESEGKGLFGTVGGKSAFPGVSGDGKLFTFPVSPTLKPKPFSPPNRTPPSEGAPVAHPFSLNEDASTPVSSSPAPQAPQPFSAPRSTSASLDSFETRLTRFYQKHNPTKLGDIPGLLEKYRGKETELFEKLKKKYNLQSVDDAPPTSTPAVAFGSSNGGVQFGAPNVLGITSLSQALLKTSNTASNNNTASNAASVFGSSFASLTPASGNSGFASFSNGNTGFASASQAGGSSIFGASGGSTFGAPASFGNSASFGTPKQ